MREWRTPRNNLKNDYKHYQTNTFEQQSLDKLSLFVCVIEKARSWSYTEPVKYKWMSSTTSFTQGASELHRN